MKTAFTALIFMSVLLATPSTAVWAQEVLTNDSIVQMVKGGLPESLIVAKIRSSQTQFDVRSEALIALKQVGVPDKILEAMLAQTAQAVLPSPPAPQPAPLPPADAPPPRVIHPAIPRPIEIPGGMAAFPSPFEAPQGRGTVYHVLGDKYVELTPVGAEIQTHTVPFFGYRTSELALPGSKAGYRTVERQPVFFSSSPPSDMPLVRLKPGSDDRNLKFSSASKLPFVGTTQRQGVRAEDRIDVEAERDARGLYRIRPRKVLEPGEYGFVLMQGFAMYGFVGGASGKVYDFGVD